MSKYNIYDLNHWPSQVKNLPAMQETQVQSLGQEDPLDEEMAPHSSILAKRIPWTKELGWLQSMGLQSQTRLKQLSIPITIPRLK